jgi:hypothetical protein
MRTGYLAADFERSERLNRAPEYWNSFKMSDIRPLANMLIGWLVFYWACNTSIAPGLRFRNDPKATASCSRQNSLNTYLFIQFWLEVFLGF